MKAFLEATTRRRPSSPPRKRRPWAGQRGRQRVGWPERRQAKGAPGQPRGRPEMADLVRIQYPLLCPLPLTCPRPSSHSKPCRKQDMNSCRRASKKRGRLAHAADALAQPWGCLRAAWRGQEASWGSALGLSRSFPIGHTNSQGGERDQTRPLG